MANIDGVLRQWKGEGRSDDWPETHNNHRMGSVSCQPPLRTDPHSDGNHAVKQERKRPPPSLAPIRVAEDVTKHARGNQDLLAVRRAWLLLGCVEK